MCAQDCLPDFCNSIISIMEKRVADLERVVANQAMLIQSMQCQIIELLNKQKNPRAASKGGGQAPAAAAKSDTKEEQKIHETVSKLCEYGVNCRKEFCKNEHQYDFCPRCKKHDRSWLAVDQFTSLNEAEKIHHLRRHKGMQYHSCWKEARCRRSNHQSRADSCIMVCNAKSQCRSGHHAKLSLSEMDENDYYCLEGDLGDSSDIIFKELGIKKKESAPYSSDDEYDPDYRYYGF